MAFSFFYSSSSSLLLHNSLSTSPLLLPLPSPSSPSPLISAFLPNPPSLSPAFCPQASAATAFANPSINNNNNNKHGAQASSLSRKVEASRTVLGLVLKRRRDSSWGVVGATPQESSGTVGSKSEAESVAEWAKPGSNVPPPWAREKSTTSSEEQSFELPFFVYLIASSLVAIAAVGSIFEFFNKRPIFDIIQQDSPFYTPILGFFAITGFPSSAFLFYKSVQIANKLSREQDREDGFLDRK